MQKKKKSSIQEPQKERPQKRLLSPEKQKQAYLLIINSIIFLFIYFGTMSTRIVIFPAGMFAPYPILLGQIVYTVYWIAFAAFLVAYVIYNRGFQRKGITIDMLPDHWSQEQKEEFIEDGKRRLEKSSWMLSVLIPLLVSIAADAIYLFTWPMVQNLFKF